VTCGGGGAVILNDEGAAKLVKHLSTTARTADGYSHDTEAFNYRLTNVQAAIGVAQMEQLDIFIERKRSIAKRYREELLDLSGGNFPNVASDSASDWVSGIVLKSSQREEIAKIVSSLGEQSIQAREFWQPIHRMVPYRSFLASTMNSMDSLIGRVLTLPNSTSLTVEQQDKVIGSLRKILTRL
jgi:dTDP-4-amino-4,6-dideoxygalactose transaminase